MKPLDTFVIRCPSYMTELLAADAFGAARIFNGGRHDKLGTEHGAFLLQAGRQNYAAKRSRRINSRLLCGAIPVYINPTLT